MDDLISRTQAIYVASGYCHPANIATELAKLPTVSPDIIHCKNCAYCDSDVIDAPYGMTKKVWWCDRLYAGANENLIIEPDDFCSWAERREDG